jgi:hypothetical protein
MAIQNCTNIYNFERMGTTPLAHDQQFSHYRGINFSNNLGIMECWSLLIWDFRLRIADLYLVVEQIVIRMQINPKSNIRNYAYSSTPILLKSVDS